MDQKVKAQRAIPRAAVAAAVGLAIIAVSAIGPATSAHAGSGWTKISNLASDYPRIANIVEPTVGRLGPNMQVVWQQTTTPDSAAYHTAVISASGTIATPATPIITDWKTLIANPRLTTVNGQPFLGFAGLRTGSSGAESYATSADGLTWTVGPGSLSSTMNAYASNGNDIVDSAGTPVWIGNPGTVNGVQWHLGISPTDPAAPGTDGSHVPTGCCGYDAAGVRDLASGAVIAAFYSNASAASEQGIQVGQILPTAGAFAQAPDSVTNYEGTPSSLEPGQRVALVAKPGGGALVAYLSGYPTAKRVRVWDTGTGATVDIPGSAGARKVAMAIGPAGETWVAWLTGSKVKIVRVAGKRVVRGSLINWPRPGGTSELWKIAVSSGAAKRLDVIITASDSGSQVINLWYRQASHP